MLTKHKKNKITYWTNRSLDKAPCGIRFSDRAQQVGHMISESFQFVWSTGKELILPLQFGLVGNLDIPFFQSSQYEQSLITKFHWSARKLGSNSNNAHKKHTPWQCIYEKENINSCTSACPVLPFLWGEPDGCSWSHDSAASTYCQALQAALLDRIKSSAVSYTLSLPHCSGSHWNTEKK